MCLNIRLKIYAIALVILVFCACKHENEASKVTVSIENFPGKKIFFIMQGEKDTLLVGDDNTCVIVPRVPLPEFVRIEIPGLRDDIVLLVDSFEQAKVSVNVQLPDSAYVITGSRGSMELDTMKKHYDMTLTKLLEIKKRFNEMSISTETTDIEGVVKVFQDEYDSVVAEEKSFLADFVRRNYRSMASMSALFQSLDVTTGRPLLMDVPMAVALYDMADSALMNRYPWSKTVRDFHSGVSNIKSALVKEEMKQSEMPVNNRVSVGQQAPNVIIKNLQGDEIELKKMRGSVVLLDFWASWCVPCRRQNPELVGIYEKYKSRGFKIFQISLDKDAVSWKTAVEKDKLSWPYHGCDFGFWSTKPVVDYGVTAIPASFVVDKNGLVQGINLSGDELMRKIEKLL